MKRRLPSGPSMNSRSICGVSHKHADLFGERRLAAHWLAVDADRTALPAIAVPSGPDPDGACRDTTVAATAHPAGPARPHRRDGRYR